MTTIEPGKRRFAALEDLIAAALGYQGLAISGEGQRCQARYRSRVVSRGRTGGKDNQDPLARMGHSKILVESNQRDRAQDSRYMK